MPKIVAAKPIPEIRDRLNEIAVEENLPEVAELAEATRRRSSHRRAPPDQKPITRETCERVREFYKWHPTMHLAKIAIRFGLGGSGGGRVSEIINGMRNGQTYEEAHGL